MSKFHEQLAFGKAGELQICNALSKANNWAIVPVGGGLETDGPRVHFGGELLIAPDQLAFSNDGFGCFIEVKRKNRWVQWNGVTETGFNLNCFKDYLRVMQLTDREIKVIWLHERKNPGIWWANLSEIASHARVWDGTVRGRRVESAMALFDKRLLREWPVVQ